MGGSCKTQRVHVAVQPVELLSTGFSPAARYRNRMPIILVSAAPYQDTFWLGGLGVVIFGPSAFYSTLFTPSEALYPVSQGKATRLKGKRSGRSVGCQIDTRRGAQRCPRTADVYRTTALWVLSLHPLVCYPKSPCSNMAPTWALKQFLCPYSWAYVIMYCIGIWTLRVIQHPFRGSR